VERRIGPFPGNRRILASFRLTASRAFYAIPKHAGSRIQLKFQHLQEGTRIAGPPHRPCDASCQKCPQDATQNPGPRTQPIENKELKTS
jgi:hypothetical protein